MNLICVSPDRAVAAWQLARDHVYSAMDRVGLQDARDVEFDVLSGAALLWLAIDEKDVIGAGATRLLEEYGERVCEIIAWGATDQARCTPLLEVLEKYARDEGCQRCRIIGRRGWERMLPEYKPLAVIFEKELV